MCLDNSLQALSSLLSSPGCWTLRVLVISLASHLAISSVHTTTSTSTMGMFSPHSFEKQTWAKVRRQSGRWQCSYKNPNGLGKTQLNSETEQWSWQGTLTNEVSRTCPRPFSYTIISQVFALQICNLASQLKVALIFKFWFHILYPSQSGGHPFSQVV